MLGKLQERYGMAIEDAEKEIEKILVTSFKESVKNYVLMPTEGMT